MAITGQSIITKAAIVLQDVTGVRWPISEMVPWFNSGQREIVLHKPDASTLNGNITLAANTSKQVVPSTALRLIDIVRNMGVGGANPGSAITVVTRQILDTQIPNWHVSAAASEIKHFVFDQRDPKTFYVWPRPNGAIQVEAITSVSPTEITEAGGVAVGNLALDDIYEGAMLDYLLYRAFLKDSQYAGNAARAAAHYQAFGNALGIRLRVDLANGPVANSAFNPNNPAFGKGTQAPAA